MILAVHAAIHWAYKYTRMPNNYQSDKDNNSKAHNVSSKQIKNTIALNPRVSPKNDDKDRIHPEIKSKATYQSDSNTTDDSEIVKNFKSIPENVSFSLPKFIAGTVPGRRPYQEDRMTIHQFTIHSDDQYKRIFQIFLMIDGHGGHFVANYIKLHLKACIEAEIRELYKNTNSKNKTDDDYKKQISYALEKAFMNCDDNLFKFSQDHKGSVKSNCGATTCCVVYNREKKILTTANLGDSRCILLERSEIIDQSEDLKPDVPSETKRIQEYGGYVSNNRINGKLAVSRAFGDFSYKNRNPHPKPDLSRQTSTFSNYSRYSDVSNFQSDDESIEIDQEDFKLGYDDLVLNQPLVTHRELTNSKKDSYLLFLCTDGVTDVFKGEAMIELMKESFKKFFELNNTEDLPEVVENVLFKSIDRGSQDNISAMFVELD